MDGLRPGRAVLVRPLDAGPPPSAGPYRRWPRGQDRPRGPRRDAGHRPRGREGRRRAEGRKARMTERAADVPDWLLPGRCGAGEAWEDARRSSTPDPARQPRTHHADGDAEGADRAGL